MCSNFVCEMTGECGNGTQEGLEECDDDNTVSGDGCSASCTIEYGCYFSNFETSYGSEEFEIHYVRLTDFVDVPQLPGDANPTMEID